MNVFVKKRIVDVCVANGARWAGINGKLMVSRRFRSLLVFHGYPETTAKINKDPSAPPDASLPTTTCVRCDFSA